MHVAISIKNSYNNFLAYRNTMVDILIAVEIYFKVCLEIAILTQVSFIENACNTFPAFSAFITLVCSVDQKASRKLRGQDFKRQAES